MSTNTCQVGVNGASANNVTKTGPTISELMQLSTTYLTDQDKNSYFGKSILPALRRNHALAVVLAPPAPCHVVNALLPRDGSSVSSEIRDA